MLQLLAMSQMMPFMAQLMGQGQQGQGGIDYASLLAPQPQESIGDMAMGLKQAQDPVGYANKMRSMPGYEWEEGGLFAEGRLDPVSRQANQGNSATNQVIRAGGSTAGGVTQEDLEGAALIQPRATPAHLLLTPTGMNSVRGKGMTGKQKQDYGDYANWAQAASKNYVKKGHF